MTIHQLQLFSPVEKRADFISSVVDFSEFGRSTNVFVNEGIRYFVNEFWTSRQRQSSSLHEISYRACFKAELPRFFIDRLSKLDDLIYDPFMGRGTTLLEATLLKRKVAGNDINPISGMLIEPRLSPPRAREVASRLLQIKFDAFDGPINDDLLVFYHLDTLRSICALREWLLEREASGVLDGVDKWIRMVALNRLTGHSSGFFSVYTLPPNQAASINSQKKINAKRGQIPPKRDVSKIIIKKTRSLLANYNRSDDQGGGIPMLSVGPASLNAQLQDGVVDLIVTSPPFLDIVDYQGDNWLRCWFAGVEASHIKVDKHRTPSDWELFVRSSFNEFSRIVRSGGHIAFEVGEVRNGSVLLEKHVKKAVEGLPFTFLGVLVNDQEFTKTANCWGVGNNKSGTNTNRVCILQRQ